MIAYILCAVLFFVLGAMAMMCYYEENWERLEIARLRNESEDK